MALLVGGVAFWLEVEFLEVVLTIFLRHTFFSWLLIAFACSSNNKIHQGRRGRYTLYAIKISARLIGLWKLYSCNPASVVQTTKNALFIWWDTTCNLIAGRTTSYFLNNHAGFAHKHLILFEEYNKVLPRAIKEKTGFLEKCWSAENAVICRQSLSWYFHYSKYAN